MVAVRVERFSQGGRTQTCGRVFECVCGKCHGPIYPKGNKILCPTTNDFVMEVTDTPGMVAESS